jgi:AraC-like DNA-binding protein
MPAAAPTFWRDDALPFIEARSIEDGARVCYDKHAHETFSIGSITGGQSTYVNGKARQRVGQGAVVVMNPNEVHACNPLDGLPWSYRMLYVDAAWLTRLQHELGFSHNLDFQPFSTLVSADPALYAGLNRMYATLTDAHAEPLQKESTALAFFAAVHERLNPAPAPAREAEHRLARAAEYIDDNYTRSLKLADICAAAALSESYLIRAFKARYGMTPHAYLINRRIQYSRAQLRRGRAIADIALEAGFSDQAHLQRVFKRMVAATPAQYQGIAVRPTADRRRYPPATAPSAG